MNTEQVKPTLSAWARKRSSGLLSTLVRPLAAAGVAPNAITVTALLLAACAAAVLANGYMAWGGGLILLAGALDALDGSLARLTGQQSRFGAFLDSTLDRYSDALVFVGLAWFYLNAGARMEVMLIFASLVGSVMVSYTRARAEGLGLECKGGLLTRLERVLIIATALIIGWVQPMLALMAVLTNVTAAQRIWHVWQVTKGE
jgi:CDP-diacylglycerol--glycerol-3-phosphate 3-phosphatidyltransferase